MKSMIIIIGIPGAGKSTLVKHLFPLHECVALDALRPRTQNAEDKLLFELCKQGKNIVVDKANIDRVTRMRYIDMAKEYGYDNIQCIIIDASYDVACARNEVRERKVPKGAIKSYCERLEYPSIDEGYTLRPWIVWNEFDPRRKEVH